MTTKYIVNNVSGQTINGDITINGGLIVTGNTNTRPYKVYTALLTQSGGDNSLEVNGEGSLTKGVTYTIVENNQPFDLSSFGAPNNNVGTTFCSTLTGPINGDGPDSIYVSYNTGAPVVTVLENTIGNVWFTYNNVGQYFINSNLLFTENKTFMELSNVTNVTYNSSGNAFIGLGFLESDSQLTIQSVALTDGDMYNTPIEIRVYN